MTRQAEAVFRWVPASQVRATGVQEFYIPSANQADRAANRGGAFFITNDGIHFTPAPYHP